MNISISSRPLHDWDALVQADRAHRILYTDPAVFQEEMTKVFGAVWVYLGHESQIPKKDDFIATKLGLRPVILLRDSAGALRALYNRCTHRGSTVCRAPSGNAKAFQCPYHGWTFHNSGRLAGVPWPDGYACDFKDDKFNLAQVPRVESYRGFIFGTLNAEMPTLKEYLGEAARPLDDWIDRNPGGRIAVCGANRLKYKGNWKLAYDNSCDGYHVVFSHRSLLEMENRDERDPNKGMAYYKSKPDEAPMYCRCYGRGHHLKDKRPNVEKRPGALWEIESAHPGKEHYEAKLRERFGKEADRWLDLASSEPINLTIFPNLLILGNHIQVLEPVSVDETDTVWYGTVLVDGPDMPPGVAEDINALRLRTQEGFPSFGEVDDLCNFEEIQKGLAAQEDEWVYMHRGMDIPGRITTDDKGVVTGPATDEVFMRLYIHHWKELMKANPDLLVKRAP